MIQRTYNRGASRRSTTENLGGDIDKSGRKVRETHPTDKAPKRFESRHQVDSSGVKRPRSQRELRDSTREPSRGRAEFTGQMNKRVTNRGGSVRTGRTASKGMGRGESR